MFSPQIIWYCKIINNDVTWNNIYFLWYHCLHIKSIYSKVRICLFYLKRFYIKGIIFYCLFSLPTLYLPLLYHFPINSFFDFPIRCETAGGPAPENSPCIFPFIYGGVTYLGCAGDPAEDKKAERWCSTKIDAKGKHMEGTNHYGFCPSSCPSHYDIQIPVVSVTPHGVTAVPAITRKPKNLPEIVNNDQSGKLC